MKTVINIKTDKEIKEKAQKLAHELGVPLSTLVNAYLRQFIRTREFSFSLAYSMSPELEKIIDEVEKDIGGIPFNGVTTTYCVCHDLAFAPLH